MTYRANVTYVHACVYNLYKITHPWKNIQLCKITHLSYTLRYNLNQGVYNYTPMCVKTTHKVCKNNTHCVYLFQVVIASQKESVS